MSIGDRSKKKKSPVFQTATKITEAKTFSHFYRAENKWLDIVVCWMIIFISTWEHTLEAHPTEKTVLCVLGDLDDYL